MADLLHPDDKDIILAGLTDAIHDSTNQIKYDVDYRLRMRDSEYQWFRAIAEVTRRADGSTLRIQQMFVNIMSNAIKYTPDGGNIVFS